MTFRYKTIRGHRIMGICDANKSLVVDVGYTLSNAAPRCENWIGGKPKKKKT
jgi:hypothetical protein